ncbi:MAG: S49 family peptidase [Candidatus Thorarchaeota archaeon]
MENVWLCEPEYLKNYLETVINANVDSSSIDAIGDLDSQGRNRLLEVTDDVAKISIQGVLSRHGPSLIDLLFGFDGTAYFEIIDAIKTVESNNKVTKVILSMDTPGGEVQGVEEVANAVTQLASKKEVVAINEGMIASAGYWIASQATRIEAVSQIALTGSIGVILVGLDTTGYQENIGIKRIKIISKNAPKKQADVNTEEGIETLQKLVNSIERVFISQVANGRQVKEEIVKKDFGQGGLLIARDPDSGEPDALTAGLIDYVQMETNNVSKFEGAINSTIHANTSVDSSGIDLSIEAGATAFKNFPIVDKRWDSNAAIKRVRKFTNSTEKPSAKYRQGFFWFDADDKQNFGAYKLPFVDVVDGSLVAIKKGVFAANAAMKGARGGVKIPAENKAAVQKHIDRYRSKIEKEDQKPQNKTKENFSMSDLIKELCAEHPDLNALIEELKAGAYTAGAASVDARVAKAIPIIESDAYPKPIKALACKVVSGESEAAALEGAVAVFDSTREDEKTKAAVEATNEVVETPAQQPEALSNDGVIRNEADYNASIEAARKGGN